MQAVIFDRDGVIVNSELCNINSVTNAFKKLNVDISEEDKKYVVAKHPADYQKYFQDQYDFSYDEFRKIQSKEYHKLINNVKPIEFAVSLINDLHTKGVTLALATSSSMRSTTKVLTNTGLNDVFKEVVTFDDCDKRKPDPESYLLTARKLGVEPNECVVFEDSGVGLVAAKAAGMKCIVIPNEYTKDHDFSGADLIVNSASEITLEVLNNLPAFA